MYPHDHGVDIWATGVVAYELRHHRHPWKLADNPWKPVNVGSGLVDLFLEKYRQVHKQLSSSDRPADTLILSMLRYGWAPLKNDKPRPTAKELLAPVNW